MTHDAVRRYYRTVWSDLADIKIFVYFAVGVFLLGIVLGVLLPEVSIERLAIFREFAESLKGQGAGSLIVAIFLKNASATAASILLGVVIGIVPLFAASSNGMLLGALLLLQPAGLWCILPHGVFELPAVFIAWGVGIWIGLWVFGPDRLGLLRVRLRRGGRIFLAVVLPLLVVAAIIEGLAAAYLYGF